MAKAALYLVPESMTKEQQAEIERTTEARVNAGGDETDVFLSCVFAVGTPVRNCKDVETAAYAIYSYWGGQIMDIRAKEVEAESISRHIKTPNEIRPLVLRTDMEAQVARVAAEKDAEIARLRKALTDLSEHIDCGCMPCTGQCWDKEQLRDELVDRVDIARAALNEGAAE